MVYAKSSDPGPYEPAAPGDMAYERSPNAKEVKLGPFPYEFGKGFVLARGPNGEVDFSAKGYVRYLNQLGLDHILHGCVWAHYGARSETRHSS